MGATYFESESDSTWHKENLEFLFQHVNHYFYTDKGTGGMSTQEEELLRFNTTNDQLYKTLKCGKSRAISKFMMVLYRTLGDIEKSTRQYQSAPSDG